MVADAGAITSLTGQQAKFSVGSPSAITGVDVSITGQQATYSNGTLSVTGDANFTITGQSATFIVNTKTGFGLWAREAGGTTPTWTIERKAA